MRLFFAENLDYVDFVYCVSFFLLCFVCRTVSRETESRLKWNYLFGFALLQAVDKAYHLLLDDHGHGSSNMTLHIFLILSSYLFLLEFGKRGLESYADMKIGRKFYLIPILLSL